MAAKNLRQEFDELRENAMNLGKQISEVTQEYLESSKDNMEEIPKGILKHLNRNLKQVRRKVSDITEDAVEQSKKVNETIRDKPYVFLATALGVGILLGTMIFRGHDRG